MKFRGKIKRGHGVASGKAGDPRYPEGTLKMQYPYFKDRGLDLSPYFLGTINLDIAPFIYEIRRPKLFLENVNWSEFIPPENFYFFDLVLYYKNKSYQGLIYMPDPATKVEHEQKKTVLELILPKIHELNYGDQVEIEVFPDQLLVYESLE